MTDPSPLVSIAIRAHRRQWLDGAIASVLRQTHRDLELIVYDDAGDLEVIATRIADPRIRYQRATTKYQASGRFLAAVSFCRGGYIGLLDDDDRYEPTFVERLVAALRDSPRAGVAFCRTTWECDGRIHQPSDGRPPGTQPNAAEQMLRDGWTISPSHMLMRRAALEDALARQPMPDGVSPDVFVNLQIAVGQWEHVLVDAPLVVCRWHGDQLSRSAAYVDTAVATWETLKFRDPRLDALRDLRLTRALLMRAFMRIGQGEAERARADLELAQRITPSAWRGLRFMMRQLARSSYAGRFLVHAWTAWSPHAWRRRQPPRVIGDRALRVADSRTHSEG